MNVKLSQHFSLGELCKTSVKTADGNIPSHVAIENLKNICENWLEDLRYSYSTLYPEISPRATLTTSNSVATRDSQSKLCSPLAAPSLGRDDTTPLIITSGYRSPEVNKRVGGSPTSNHLTGCAVDIRCYGIEQAIRYASILLDIADGTKRDYDELLIERSPKGNYWIHFAVRPANNRRKTAMIQT